MAPYPPLPPFPRSPPTRLLHEPSLLGSCGHLAVPLDPDSVVRYPGGRWQYFAEWSGLDEQAQSEQHRDSYGSYTYGYRLDEDGRVESHGV